MLNEVPCRRAITTLSWFTRSSGGTQNPFNFSVLHWIAMFSPTAAFRLPLRRVQLSATTQAAYTPYFREKSSWTCDDNFQPLKLVEKSRKRKYEGAAEKTEDKRVGSELPSQPAVARRVIKVNTIEQLLKLS